MGEQQYFTLDQLAAAASMTARNVRAYQTRGLLPPPVRDGRSAVYDTDHLDRLAAVRRLREAGVPLRMIQQAVARGEDLGATGPLHTWTAGDGPAGSGRDGTETDVTGPSPAVPDADGALHAVDRQTLDLAERAAPGLRAALLELRLLVEDPPGPRAVAAVVDLLGRMPSLASSHPHVVEVVHAAGRLSESVRRALAAHAPGTSPDHGPAQTAAAVIQACLTGHPAQIDLRETSGSTLPEGSGG